MQTENKICGGKIDEISEGFFVANLVRHPVFVSFIFFWSVIQFTEKCIFRNANVFPLPVLEIPIMSLPDIATGMA